MSINWSLPKYYQGDELPCQPNELVVKSQPHPSEEVLDEIAKTPESLEEWIRSVAADPNRDILISFTRKIKHPRTEEIIRRIYAQSGESTSEPPGK